MKKLMSHDRIVLNGSTFEEGRLHGGNNFVQQRLKPIG